MRANPCFINCFINIYDMQDRRHFVNVAMIVSVSPMRHGGSLVQLAIGQIRTQEAVASLQSSIEQALEASRQSCPAPGSYPIAEVE